MRHVSFEVISKYCKSSLITYACKVYCYIDKVKKLCMSKASLSADRHHQRPLQHKVDSKLWLNRYNPRRKEQSCEIARPRHTLEIKAQIRILWLQRAKITIKINDFKKLFFSIKYVLELLDNIKNVGNSRKMILKIAILRQKLTIARFWSLSVEISCKGS